MLRFLCNAPGQYTFACLYIITILVLLALYRLGSLEASKIPASIQILLILSKRIHSIYVLRMFNDCVAMACGYMAVLLFTKNEVSTFLHIIRRFHLQQNILLLALS